MSAMSSLLRDRSRLGWLLLRWLLAGLIAAHGWARLIHGGVPPFGDWLNGQALLQGLPGDLRLGLAIAIGITALEILGTPLLAAGRFVAPLALLYAAVYAVGIALVHAKAGWFVVGLGRNGAEYSVLLIACLLCVGMQHLGRR
jgi:putative oxidoreductase